MRFLLFFLAFLVVVVLGKEINQQNEQRHSIGSHYHSIAYGKRSVSITAPDSDIEALVKFYSELDGNKWTNNRGWLIGNPCNSWYGIVCNVNTSRVSAILLAQNNLRGTIPIELSLLTGLEVLDLSANHLSSSIPRGLFSPLSLFRELYLNTNELSGSLEFFEDLPVSMEIMYLPNNKFSGEIPATIGKFTSLYNFQLFSNQLSGTIPPTVGLMSSLESLDFGFNLLTGTLPMEIGNLQNLENFWIYDDKISGPLPEYWGNMKKLKLFEITRNEISGTIPDSWANMESLEVFRVGGNQMSGTPNQICNMLNLTEVSLYSNGFTGIPTCGNNSQMRIFYMNNNQIGGEIPYGIGLLTSLQRIDFSHNQISGTVP